MYLNFTKKQNEEFIFSYVGDFPGYAPGDENGALATPTGGGGRAPGGKLPTGGIALGTEGSKG